MVSLFHKAEESNARFMVRQERWILKGNFLTDRMMRLWNNVQEEGVEPGTMVMFKRHFDRYMD